MTTKLFVGSLSFNVSSDDLKELFAAHGTVESAAVITDRDSGRSKGFGFVEMSSEEEAAACIKALNEQDVQGRQINVSIAKPKEERPNRAPGGRF